MPPLGLGRRQGDVRFGSKAEVKATNIDVRFTPESGHVQCTSDVRLVPIADIPRCPRYIRFKSQSAETDRTTPIQAA